MSHATVKAPLFMKMDPTFTARINIQAKQCALECNIIKKEFESSQRILEKEMSTLQDHLTNLKSVYSPLDNKLWAYGYGREHANPSSGLKTQSSQLSTSTPTSVINRIPLRKNYNLNISHGTTDTDKPSSMVLEARVILRRRQSQNQTHRPNTTLVASISKNDVLAEEVFMIDFNGLSKKVKAKEQNQQSNLSNSDKKLHGEADNDGDEGTGDLRRSTTFSGRCTQMQDAREKANTKVKLLSPPHCSKRRYSAPAKLPIKSTPNSNESHSQNLSTNEVANTPTNRTSMTQVENSECHSTGNGSDCQDRNIQHHMTEANNKSVFYGDVNEETKDANSLNMHKNVSVNNSVSTTECKVNVDVAETYEFQKPRLIPNCIHIVYGEDPPCKVQAKQAIQAKQTPNICVVYSSKNNIDIAKQSKDHKLQNNEEDLLKNVIIDASNDTTLYSSKNNKHPNQHDNLNNNITKESVSEQHDSKNTIPHNSHQNQDTVKWRDVDEEDIVCEIDYAESGPKRLSKRGMNPCRMIYDTPSILKRRSPKVSFNQEVHVANYFTENDDSSSELSNLEGDFKNVRTSTPNSKLRQRRSSSAMYEGKGTLKEGGEVCTLTVPDISEETVLCESGHPSRIQTDELPNVKDETLMNAHENDMSEISSRKKSVITAANATTLDIPEKHNRKRKTQSLKLVRSWEGMRTMKSTMEKLNTDMHHVINDLQIKRIPDLPSKSILETLESGNPTLKPETRKTNIGGFFVGPSENNMNLTTSAEDEAMMRAYRTSTSGARNRRMSATEKRMYERRPGLQLLKVLEQQNMEKSMAHKLAMKRRRGSVVKMENSKTSEVLEYSFDSSLDGEEYWKGII